MKCVWIWLFALVGFRDLIVPSSPSSQNQHIGCSCTRGLKGARILSLTKSTNEIFVLTTTNIPAPRLLTLRGGVRPDHLPRSFKRALRRHTKARLQEEHKGRFGSLSRKIAAIKNAREAAAKASEAETLDPEQQQLTVTKTEDYEGDSMHSSSEIGGRGGWMNTLAEDPEDMTVLLQVAHP